MAVGEFGERAGGIWPTFLNPGLRWLRLNPADAPSDSTLADVLAMRTEVWPLLVLVGEL